MRFVTNSEKFLKKEFRRHDHKESVAYAATPKRRVSTGRALKNIFGWFVVKVTMNEIATLYINSKLISVQYAATLVRTARRAKDFGITCDNIDDQIVNKFILSLSSDLSLISKGNIRRELLTLWRYGYEMEMCKSFPRHVARIHAPQAVVEAWSNKELSSILSTAKLDTTEIGGRTRMRICDYLPCWIRVGYETGMRHGDILSLTTTELRNGCVCKPAGKTGKLLVRKIESETQVLAQALLSRSPDGSVFTWFLTRRRSFTSMKEFFERHKIQGTSKYLRRSCATAIANESPSKASAYLQHSKESLLKHYVDESLLDVPEGPPPIR